MVDLNRSHYILVIPIFSPWQGKGRVSGNDEGGVRPETGLNLRDVGG